MRLGMAAALATFLAATGCVKQDPLFCDETHPCTDPARPYCDLQGIYPGSDGHGKSCVPNPFDAAVIDAPPPVYDAPPGSHNLTVTRTGNGLGRVTSAPAGIDCGSSCTAAFVEGTTVTLTAVPEAGSAFAGWSGACSGFGACSVAMDADKAVGARFGVPGEVTWLAQISGSTLAGANAVEFDGAGDAIVAGRFIGTSTVGSTTLNDAGAGDVLVVKLSGRDGTPLWARGFGGPGEDWALSVAVDGLGDVVVTGHFSNTMAVGTSSLVSAGDKDVFIAKLSGSDGAPVWARRFGGSGADSAAGITTDGLGNVIASGSTASDSALFGGTPLVGFGGRDAWIGKYSGVDGGFSWAKRYGTLGEDSGTAVETDGIGNVVVAGSFAPVGDSLSLGGSSLASNGSSDLFVGKLDGDQGDHVRSKALGGGADDLAASLAVDGANGVLVVGTFQGTVSFAGSTVMSSGSTDVIVAKYSSAGAPAWARAFGGSGLDAPGGVALTGGGDVVVAGYFQGTANLGGASLTSAGSVDGYFARYSGSDGAAAWSRRLGGSGLDMSLAVAAQPGGAAVVAGGFSGLADFGGLTATATGTTNGFCVQVLP